MMSLRTRIFIVVSLIVLFVLGVTIILVLRNKAKNKPSPSGQTQQETQYPNGQVTGQNGSVTTQPTSVPEGIPIKKSTTLESEQNGVKQLAKVYVERYGTYSTQNQFQNIKDLEDLSTESLWNKFSATISKAQTASEYLGVTTKVITTEFSKWESASAVVLLRASRTEEKVSGTPIVKYLDYTVNLVKTGDNWLVDKIAWK